MLTPSINETVEKNVALGTLSNEQSIISEQPHTNENVKIKSLFAL